MAYLQKSGFANPIFVAEKTELDMKMPNAKVDIVAFFLCNSCLILRIALVGICVVENAKYGNLVRCKDLLRGGREKCGWVTETD